MNKTIFKILGVFFGVLVGNTACATTNSMDDQLSQLIRKVQEPSSSREQMDRVNGQIARASWQVRCWVRIFEDSKICVIQKEHLTIMRLNNTYSVSIGNQHLKGSFSSLRIDGNKVVKAQEGLYRDATPIIDQMKRGYYLFTRYHTQDKANTIENKISLMGLTDAYNDMQIRYRKLDAISYTQR